jgi:hypothetical protein
MFKLSAVSMCQKSRRYSLPLQESAIIENLIFVRRCIASGYLCLDHSYKLVKRMAKDGTLVEVSD